MPKKGKEKYFDDLRVSYEDIFTWNNHLEIYLLSDVPRHQSCMFGYDLTGHSTKGEFKALQRPQIFFNWTFFWVLGVARNAFFHFKYLFDKENEKYIILLQLEAIFILEVDIAINILSKQFILQSLVFILIKKNKIFS